MSSNFFKLLIPIMVLCESMHAFKICIYIKALPLAYIYGTYGMEIVGKRQI